MLCPACQAPILRSHGENTKDFHCSNYNCASRKEIRVFSHVSVVPSWWFAAKYTIPFKFNNEWHCVKGPEYDIFSFKIGQKSFHRSIFYKIIMMIQRQPWHRYEEPSFENAFSIPYMALPVNSDFNKEFDILIDKFKKLAILA